MGKSVTEPGKPRALAGLSSRAERRILALLPLAVVAAYWSGHGAVLFVVSFLFPLLLAAQAYLAPEAAPRPAATATRPKPEQRETVPGDALTGLPGRAEAMVQLSRFLDQARASDRIVTVFYIDLDRFDSINKRFGLATGDMVLRTTSERLRAITRERDLVARVDGDAFVVALAPSRRPDGDALLAVATRLQKAIAEPLSLDRGSLHVTCSVGYCQSDRAPSRDAQALLGAAETACSVARIAGAGSVRSFSPRMCRDAQRQQELAGEIEAALENGQIRPWFQPQIALETGRLAGFEALARWEHPEHGLVSPGQFLPAIEAAGRSTRLTEIILEHAALALLEWDRAGHHVPGVGVNFATDELRDPRFVDRIRWLVERHELAPSRFSIEVLETVFTQHDDDEIARNIRALAQHGFCIDLDDFGTGHASISNIRRFAVDRLKIDRSFVSRIDTDVEQQRIATAIIRMAEGLGLEALAEGVETMEEAHMLHRLGCRYAQGYALARPMPFGKTLAWLAAQPGPEAPPPAWHVPARPDTPEQARRAG